MSSYLAKLVDLTKNLEWNGSDLLLYSSVAAVSVITIYIGKIWYSYRFFEKRGIKTPQYKFFSGNMEEIIAKNYSQVLKEWTEKYGKTYGYYQGHTPILVTSDLEIIDEIFNRQFWNFTARKLLPFQTKDNGPETEVFLSSRNKWKRLRSVSKSAFSPARLKEILPVMKLCSDRLMNLLEKNGEREMNISECLDRLTMDVVWNCGYGVNIDLQSNPKKFPFLDRTIELLQEFAHFNAFFLFLTYFPEMGSLILPLLSSYTFIASKFSEDFGNPNFWIQQRIHEVLEKKLENKTTRRDFLQTLVEAQSEKVDSKSDNINFESGQMFERKISYQETLANLVGFLIAAFDTTSATLSYCIYCLAKYPEEAIKLQNEIDSFDQTEYDYESLEKFEYLDMFIREVLRMYPIANNVIARRCTKSTNIKNIDIPVDLNIAVDVLSLHYDKKHWTGVDPYTFYPLRFKSNNKYSMPYYMPFGAGQRMCIGMKFALLEIKITLVKILQNYDIKLATSMNEKLEFQEGTVRRPKNGIKCHFIKRN